MPKKKATSTAAATDDKPAKQPAPDEVNSSLASDRMKALLKDHQAMGARPK